jgi:hypothetical protein
MVRSINEPATPVDELTNLTSPNEPAPVAVVTEDGSTVYGAEVIPPHADPVEPAQAEPADPDAKPYVKPDAKPVGLVSPVDESGLTDFIKKAGKPN